MDSENESKQLAIIEWLHTFELPVNRSCENLNDLCDGVIILFVLNQVAPGYFEADLSSCLVTDYPYNTNERQYREQALSNVNKIIQLLDDYYRYMLQKFVEMSDLIPENIAINKSTDDILSLLELIVGAATMCHDSESRGVFIERIFSLDAVSKAELMQLVQSVMLRAQDFDSLGTVEKINGNSSPQDEDLIRAEESVKHLQLEQQRLLTMVADLENNNQLLTSQNQKLQNQVNELVQERIGSPNRNQLEKKSTALVNLQIEVDELRRELDLKIVESDNLKTELQVSHRRCDSFNEVIQKLTMDNNRMADELDIARDKSSKLAKAEAAVEKYQLKLEEMTTLKKENKELSSKLDSYLDQINQLESTNKSFGTLQKLVEQYKNKAVELEREKFELLSANQVKDIEIGNLKVEYESLCKNRNYLEDELSKLQIELEQSHDSRQMEALVSKESKMEGSISLSDDIATESITTLREKLKIAEIEISNMRKNAASVNKESNGSITQDDSLTLLQAELDDMRRVKKEREESLLSAKKQVAELQHELQKSNRSVQEAEKKLAGSVSAQISEARIAEYANTVRLLEDKIKENETMINKLEQEKSKLEQYARKSLSQFREKFTTTLQYLQNEKQQVQDQLVQEKKTAKVNAEAFRREEKLLSSAMYELGMKLMDRSLSSEVASTSNGGTRPGRKPPIIPSEV